MLTAALKLADRWPVFPCRPGQKTPVTEHGFKDATQDSDQIRRWWDATPEANIAVPTGAASGIWVLDLDDSDAVDWMLDQHGGLPDTLLQETPSGGYHLVFRHPGNLGNTSRKLAPGVDTRGDGGYILVAPSRTAQGVYRWLERRAPGNVPGWLIRLACPRQPKPEPVHVEPEREPATAQGRREAYVTAALDAECRDLAAMAPKTGRNHALNRAAYNLGGFVAVGDLDEETVFGRLLQACQSNGLLAEDGARSCRATIRSGLTSGKQHPRRAS